MPLFATSAELECSECGETTASAEALQRHISVQHMKWTPWHCPHCSAFAATESLMIKHLRNSHANLDHWIKYCPDPNMAMSLASALYKSMQMSAAASKKLSASAAAKPNRQNLSLNKGRADCNICHVSVLRNNMTAHIASEHIRQPLYLCSMTECSGKRFFSSDSAKLHARKSHHRHDVIRNTRLVSRSQLDKWRRRCFSDDPTHIECRRCGPIEHSSLQKHVKSFHMKSALFRCPQCTHSSKWSENIRRHQLTVHKSRKPDPVRLVNSEKEFHRLFADCKPRRADERKKSTVNRITAAKRTGVASPNKVSVPMSVADENCSLEKKRASTRQLTDSLSPVECSACGTMCANRVDFDKHVLLTHWTRALYRCPFCSYRAKSREQTDRHIQLAHADRDYEEPKALDEHRQSLEHYSQSLLNTSCSRFCRVCNRTVTDRSLLLHVLGYHMDQALFKCELCAFSTKFSDDAHSHASQHDQKRPAFIPSAGRVFCQVFADCTGEMLAPTWWRT